MENGKNGGNGKTEQTENYLDRHCQRDRSGRAGCPGRKAIDGKASGEELIDGSMER